MSMGTVNIPWYIFPLIKLGYMKFWHSTAYYIIPPHFKRRIEWSPADEDTIYHVFAMTFGKPRNYETGEIVYTDKVYFYHRWRECVWHYDPLVESIIQVVYPHEATATIREPLEILFVNETDTVVIMDVSIWLFEYKKDFEPMLNEYLEGIFNFFRAMGKLKVEEIEGFIKTAIIRR